jgi:hypothetical protein
VSFSATVMLMEELPEEEEDPAHEFDMFPI